MVKKKMNRYQILKNEKKKGASLEKKPAESTINEELKSKTNINNC